MLPKNKHTALKQTKLVQRGARLDGTWVKMRERSRGGGFAALRPFTQKITEKSHAFAVKNKGNRALFIISL